MLCWGKASKAANKILMSIVRLSLVDRFHPSIVAYYTVDRHKSFKCFVENLDALFIKYFDD